MKLIRMAKGINSAEPLAAGAAPAAGAAAAGGTAQQNMQIAHQRALNQELANEASRSKQGVQTLGRTQYVITIDNLLKILSILLRLEYGIPAILMGETGCGKTALVRDHSKFSIRKRS